MGEEAYIDPSSMFTALKTASCPAKNKPKQKTHLCCRAAPAGLTSPLNSPQGYKTSQFAPRVVVGTYTKQLFNTNALYRYTVFNLHPHPLKWLHNIL